MALSTEIQGDIRRVIRMLASPQQEVDLAIMRTPTSEDRNALTEANIHLNEAIQILSKLGQGESNG